MAGLSEVVLDRSFPVVTKMGEGLYVTGDKKTIDKIPGLTYVTPFQSALYDLYPISYVVASYVNFFVVSLLSVAIIFTANKILAHKAVSILLASAIALHPFSTLAVAGAAAAAAILLAGAPV